MAENKTSRLAEIYRSEKRSGGGILSTIGKRGLEKIDPRQFFNQQGFLAAAFPKLFKTYRATTAPTSKVNKISDTVSTQQIELNLSFIANKLAEIKIDSKLIAKNTLVMPMMARDTNIMRQNIGKMVKLLGGTATNKSDMFFKKASEREAEYESKFKKESKNQTGRAPVSGSTGKDGGGGFLSNLLGGMGKGIGKGVGIAATGAGIAGFLVSIAGAAWAVSKIGGVTGLKDLLVNLAEGLGAFSGQSLLALGGLMAAGGLFGAAKGPVKAAQGSFGITMIGAGIAGFLTALSAGGKLSELIGSSAGVRDMLVNLAEGLNAFSGQSLLALSGLLAAGGLFGPIAAASGALGMTLIGTGLAGFMTALSAGGKLSELIGGATGLRDFLVNFAEGLGALGQINGDNLIKVTAAIAGLGPAMALFFSGKGIGSVMDFVSTGFDRIKNFLFGGQGDKSKGLIQSLVEQLKPMESLNAKSIKDVGDGLMNLTIGMKNLASLSDKDLERIQKAGQVARSVAGVVAPSGVTSVPAPAPSAKAPAPAPATSGKPSATTPAPATKAPAPIPTFTPNTSSPTSSGYISKAAEIIMKEEGLPKNGKAYWDPSGQRTLVSVGYGHQIKSHEYSQGFIQAGNERVPIVGERGIDTVLTKNQAQKLLEMDLPRYESAAAGPLGEAWNKLNDNQKAAMISYAYNTGSTSSLVKKGLKKAIMENNMAEAGNIISQKGIVTAGGIQNAALVKRRKDESILFASAPTTPTTGTTLAQASTQVADGRIQMASMQPNNVVNNQTINNVSNAGGSKQVARAPSVFDRDLLGTIIATNIVI